MLKSIQSRSRGTHPRRRGMTQTPSTGSGPVGNKQTMKMNEFCWSAERLAQDADASERRPYPQSQLRQRAYAHGGLVTVQDTISRRPDVSANTGQRVASLGTTTTRIW